MIEVAVEVGGDLAALDLGEVAVVIEGTVVERPVAGARGGSSGGRRSGFGAVPVRAAFAFVTLSGMRIAVLLAAACAACGPAARPAQPIVVAAPRPAEEPVVATRPAKVFDRARFGGCRFEAFVLDDESAFVSCEGGVVYSAVGGSAPKLLAKGVMWSSQAIAVDETRVFFMSKANEVSSVPKGGGAPSVFVNGLQVLAMRTYGQELVAAVYKQGYARLPLLGGAPVVVSAVAVRDFVVANDTVYFVDYVGKEQHVFAAPFASPGVTDLGKVPWVVEQVAVAGGTLFDGSELDLASHTRRKLPQDCTSFATDAKFVYAACDSGLIAREHGAMGWKNVADSLVQPGLALNRSHACWPDVDGEITRVRCVVRPNGLR